MCVFIFAITCVTGSAAPSSIVECGPENSPDVRQADNSDLQARTHASQQENVVLRRRRLLLFGWHAATKTNSLGDWREDAKDHNSTAMRCANRRKFQYQIARCKAMQNTSCEHTRRQAVPEERWRRTLCADQLAPAKVYGEHGLALCPEVYGDSARSANRNAR